MYNVSVNVPRAVYGIDVKRFLRFYFFIKTRFNLFYFVNIFVLGKLEYVI